MPQDASINCLFDNERIVNMVCIYFAAVASDDYLSRGVIGQRFNIDSFGGQTGPLQLAKSSSLPANLPYTYPPTCTRADL